MAPKGGNGRASMRPETSHGRIDGRKNAYGRNKRKMKGTAKYAKASIEQEDMYDHEFDFAFSQEKRNRNTEEILSSRSQPAARKSFLEQAKADQSENRGRRSKTEVFQGPCPKPKAMANMHTRIPKKKQGNGPQIFSRSRITLAKKAMDFVDVVEIDKMVDLSQDKSDANVSVHSPDSVSLSTVPSASIMPGISDFDTQIHVPNESDERPGKETPYASSTITTHRNQNGYKPDRKQLIGFTKANSKRAPGKRRNRMIATPTTESFSASTRQQRNRFGGSNGTNFKNNKSAPCKAKKQSRKSTPDGLTDTDSDSSEVFTTLSGYGKRSGITGQQTSSITKRKRSIDSYSSTTSTRKNSLRSAKKSKKSPEVIEIDSDSEAPEMVRNKSLHAPLSRIMIGNKLLSNGVRVELDLQGMSLAFVYRSNGSTRKRQNGSDVELRYQFNLESEVQEVKYFVPSRQTEGSDTIQNSAFLVVNVEVTPGNCLKKFGYCYVPKSRDATKKFITMEFATGYVDLFQALEKNYSVFMNEESKLTNVLLGAYVSGFGPPKPKETVDLATSVDDEKRIMFTYPFDGDHAVVDACTDGLGELAFKGTELRDSDGNKGSNAESRMSIAVSVADYNRLDEGEYLNDQLVDFWLHWLWRKLDKSKVHVFSSQFYTKLEEGTDAVTRWTERRGVDVFTKKFIYIPINKSNHWSLCVVVNPGAIEIQQKLLKTKDFDVAKGVDFPCILFFDSLRTYHNKTTIADKLRKWLNNEWKRTFTEEKTETSSTDVSLFTQKTYRVYNPKIPYQTNGCDCGVFTCRYGYAMSLLVNEPFTYESAGVDAPNFQSLSRTKMFASLITENEAFNFGMSDVVRIRSEFKTFIKRLEQVYVQSAMQEDEEGKKPAAKTRDMENRCDNESTTGYGTVQNEGEPPMSDESSIDTKTHSETSRGRAAQDKKTPVGTEAEHPPNDNAELEACDPAVGSSLNSSEVKLEPEVSSDAAMSLGTDLVSQPSGPVLLDSQDTLATTGSDHLYSLQDDSAAPTNGRANDESSSELPMTQDRKTAVAAGVDLSANIKTVPKKVVALKPQAREKPVAQEALVGSNQADHEADPSSHDENLSLDDSDTEKIDVWNALAKDATVIDLSNPNGGSPVQCPEQNESVANRLPSYKARARSQCAKKADRKAKPSQVEESVFSSVNEEHVVSVGAFPSKKNSKTRKRSKRMKEAPSVLVDPSDEFL